MYESNYWLGTHALYKAEYGKGVPVQDTSPRLRLNVRLVIKTTHQNACAEKSTRCCIIYSPSPLCSISQYHSKRHPPHPSSLMQVSLPKIQSPKPRIQVTVPRNRNLMHAILLLSFHPIAHTHTFPMLTQVMLSLPPIMSKTALPLGYIRDRNSQDAAVILIKFISFINAVDVSCRDKGCCSHWALMLSVGVSALGFKRFVLISQPLS